VSPGPRWLLPLLELGLLAPIVAANPVRLSRETIGLRRLAQVLVTALAAVNAEHLLRLVLLVTSGARSDPRVLVESALLIWTTNVVTTALALWEMDRGGPITRDPRHRRTPDRPDLLFPR
jgi:hypothetical protein